MSANRVAASGGAVAAVAAAVVSVLGEVDSTAKAIVVSVALVCIAAVVVVFLKGSQNWDRIKAAEARLTARRELVAAAVPVAVGAPTGASEATPEPDEGGRDTEVAPPDPTAAREDLDRTHG